VQNVLDSKDEKVSVMISSELYHEFQKKIEGTGFSSVDDYINFILLSSIGKKSEDLSNEDSEIITARLKTLGYL